MAPREGSRRRSEKKKSGKTGKGGKGGKGRARSPKLTRDINVIREMLLDKRKVLLHGMKEKYTEAQERSLASGDVSDRASSAAHGDLALRLAEGAAEQVTRIDEALRRIREGTYGVCQQCQGRIPAERLKIRPFSIQCVKCKTEMERLQKTGDGESGLPWGEVEEEGEA